MRNLDNTYWPIKSNFDPSLDERFSGFNISGLQWVVPNTWGGWVFHSGGENIRHLEGRLASASYKFRKYYDSPKKVKDIEEFAQWYLPFARDYYSVQEYLPIFEGLPHLIDSLKNKPFPEGKGVSVPLYVFDLFNFLVRKVFIEHPQAREHQVLAKITANAVREISHDIDDAFQIILFQREMIIPDSNRTWKKMVNRFELNVKKVEGVDKKRDYEKDAEIALDILRRGVKDGDYFDQALYRTQPNVTLCLLRPAGEGRLVNGANGAMNAL